MKNSSATYIAGVAETPLGKISDQSEYSMVELAATEALAEAGLTVRDVDAVFTNYMGEEGSVQLGEYLNIQPRFAESSDMGGASFEFFVHHAMLAIERGRASVALIAFASRQRSRRKRPRMPSSNGYSISAQFETPYAPLWPISHYALMAARHRHQYGTTLEQMAHVALSARKWAQLNPKAWSRSPLTLDEAMSSPMISEPLRKVDCCLVTDGGGVVILTDAAYARDARKKAIRVLGAGEAHDAWHIAQMKDLTQTPGRRSARDAFQRAGVNPADVDFFEPYDNFTSCVIQQLEDVGFCAPGDGGAFVEQGNLLPGGSLPTSTMGGGLSYCHPGALGVLLLVEAVRQLRGEVESERQVPDARIGVVHAIGGVCYSTAATVLLGRD